MKKDYIKKKKKMSKKTYLTLTIFAVVFVSIVFIGKYFAVDFIFDNYIVKPALEVVKEGGISEMMKQGENTDPVPEPNNGEIGSEDNSNVSENNQVTSSENVSPETTQSTAKELSTAEIAYKVLASPELMARLESMVSSSDKSAVISIAKSCFTIDEKKYYLAEIAKNGLNSQIKSEMMGIVRSRMTESKKSSVLSLFAKYAEELRPYIQ